MKSHPILFSEPMVRAILNGSKSMTRRPVKPQPHIRLGVPGWYPDGSHKRKMHYATEEHLRKGLPIDFCQYKVGDLLWVRETFRPGMHENLWCAILYRSDLSWQKPEGLTEAEGHLFESWCENDTGGWSPSIHMPRWASRIVLRITEIRLERLQEISKMDASEEGVMEFGVTRLFPKDAFWRCWDSVYDRRGFGWKTNPWVWAMTFKRDK